MKINADAWGEYRLGDLFRLERGKNKSSSDLSDGDDCYYIGAKKNNNGVMRRVAYDEKVTTKGNCIVFIGNGQGSVGYTNYMNDDFIGTSDITAGFNEHLNPLVGMFLVTVFDLERPKYSFGRKWSARIADTIVNLPQSNNGAPDWIYMQEYIKGLRYRQITTTIESSQLSLCPVETWGFYKISDIFNLENCKCNAARDLLSDGDDCYYLGAKKSENGVMRRVAYDSDLITKGNCIVFICDGQGSVGYTNYMDEDFIGSTTLTVGRSKYVNKYTGMFLVSVLDLERHKYSFGRKYRTKLSDTVIKLPTTSQGSPDWRYMERYIKSLPYSDRI